jgi:hypothetical protein
VGKRGSGAMKAVELKLAGRPTGLWACGYCKRPVAAVTYGHGQPCSEMNYELAERCCTGHEPGMHCTGCRQAFARCVCGRAGRNNCVSCGSHLFNREGVQVRWGVEVREVCYACSTTAPAAMLMDASRISAKSANSWALTAPDTFLSRLAGRGGVRSRKGEAW